MSSRPFWATYDFQANLGYRMRSYFGGEKNNKEPKGRQELT
jgi:hypothetical protein